MGVYFVFFSILLLVMLCTILYYIVISHNQLFYLSFSEQFKGVSR